MSSNPSNGWTLACAKIKVAQMQAKPKVCFSLCNQLLRDLNQRRSGGASEAANDTEEVDVRAREVALTGKVRFDHLSATSSFHM